ncbi:threonine/serine exporter family protein [Clostridium sp. 'White wine YQ']|uniref:threonine/serine exporter family protein n=1 Tax=Clostridium sp. 'White wine YQ' TaxID=3027474 RepID=UPI00236602BC|nr:threonine/serine exporter family protein [Clostridium sp. 'White wine YQ']MDD7794039.1 threonine/serine exporter family protein [Clostridium sp. 'White wine YQ']
MIKEIVVSIIATFGFGIIFNIKGKNLVFASLGGGLGWLVYKLSLTHSNSGTLALFISSIIFSAYSEILARILKSPVTTFIICALIPLVPGGGMYYTMYEIVQGNIDKSLELGLNTLASAGTLALGIIFVSSITRIIISPKPRKT